MAGTMTSVQTDMVISVKNDLLVETTDLRSGNNQRSQVSCIQYAHMFVYVYVSCYQIDMICATSNVWYYLKNDDLLSLDAWGMILILTCVV